MSQVDADHNLLFGVLALQLELIDTGQFAEACAAWAVKKDGSLADVLAEGGKITPDDRRQIDALLERKLRRHAGNARATLGAVVDAAARDALRTVDNPDVRKSLSSLPPPAGYVLVETMLKPREQRTRYALSHLHAEGGLGKVWVARDDDLHREVALKELRPERARHPDAWRRFLKEAQVTGQLEHPNIVPVYELGRRPEDDQPFYTMRFVRGQTLREAIARDHAERRKGRADPLERHRLLQAFVSVCQALAYAHSRGVVHRDLKPENIVLGGFGEVIVLDWGLAKTLGGPEETEDSPYVAVGAETATPPTIGQVGTPAYMAPEQADGRHDLVDQRTDVYGLGSILFEILTGAAPHAGNDTRELMRRIVVSETPRARAVDPTIPPALDAVCARAMAKARSERYAGAKALAEDVQCWLADEPVSVFREDLSRRAARWARKHRAAAQTGVAALLVLAIAASIATALVSRARRAAEIAADAERQAKELSLRRLSQIENANEILASVFDDLDPRAAVKEGVSLQAKLAERVDRAAELLEAEAADDPISVARLQSRLGAAQINLGYSQRAIVLLNKAQERQKALLGPDRFDTLHTMNSLAGAYRTTGQYDKAIPLYEQVLKHTEAKLGPDHRASLTVMNSLAGAYRAAGQYDRAIPRFEYVLEKRRATLGADHPDTLTSTNNLAVTLHIAGQYHRSIPVYEHILVLRKSMLGEDHPDTLIVMNNLSEAYRVVAEYDKAISLCEQTFEKRKAKLGPDHPETLTSKNNLANAYRTAGDYDAAIPLFEQVLRQFQSALSTDHPDTLTSMNGLGQAYEEAGQTEKALDLIEQAYAKRQAKLGPDHPSTLTSMNSLAGVYRTTGQYEKAIRLFEQALAKTKERFGPDHPDTLNTCNGLAAACLDGGQTARATAILTRTLERFKAVLGPEHPDTLTGMSYLADAFRAAGQPDRAIPLFEQALTTLKAKVRPDHTVLLASMGGLATAYSDQRRFDRAEPLLRETLARRSRRLTADNPLRGEAQADLARCVDAMGKHAQAETLLREVVANGSEARPDAWQTFYARSLLGATLLRQKKYAEAEVFLVEAYRGMKQREIGIPPRSRIRLAEALDLVVQLYEDWGKPDQADAWKKNETPRPTPPPI